jgi:hypothetical protein
MSDRFSIDEIGLDSPAVSAEVVTPDDANNLVQVSRALYIGTTGNVGVQMLGYDDQANVNILLENVPAGILPIRVSRVHSSNTTATGIISLY